MGFGGMHPFPKRMGGGKTRLQRVLESLNKGRGTALDTTATSVVYAENMALARGLDGAWGTNQRLANIRDPQRMSGRLLARWEKIMAIRPASEDSEVSRRSVVATRFARFGKPALHQALVDALTAALGDVYVAVEYIRIANAVIHVPDGSYPFGTVADGVPWYSSVAHVLVRLTKPTGYTEGQFYAAAGKVAEAIDPMLPAWCTFDWYRPGPISVAVSGGPSAAGFYLDETNLGNEVFA